MNVLITGASRGLGFSLTKQAVKRGHTVFAGVRNPNSSNNQQLQQLRALFPDQVHLLELDVTVEATCERAAEELKKLGVYLDAIINNAGILLARDQSVETLDLDQVHDTFDVNLYGPMRVVKHFLNRLRRSSDSTLLNISSEAGSYENAYGGDYPYALSKHALNMFTKQVRHVLSADGVQVFAVHPGWIQTDMGGSEAPGSADVTARHLLDLLERKKTISHDSVFIDFEGNPMAL